MSKYFKYILLAVIVFTAIGFSSCKKAKYPSLIQGTWKRVIVETDTALKSELWQFTEGKLIITKKTDKVVSESANYVIKSKIRRSYLTIANFNTDAYNTDWLIRTLNSDQLIIINDKEGGIKTQEFIKYSE